MPFKLHVELYILSYYLHICTRANYSRLFSFIDWLCFYEYLTRPLAFHRNSPKLNNVTGRVRPNNNCIGLYKRYRICNEQVNFDSYVFPLMCGGMILAKLIVYMFSLITLELSWNRYWFSWTAMHSV